MTSGLGEVAKSPKPLPARSPDMSSLFLLGWGVIKGQVFKTPVDYIEELMQRIREVVGSINMNMFTNTWGENLLDG